MHYFEGECIHSTITCDRICENPTYIIALGLKELMSAVEWCTNTLRYMWVYIHTCTYIPCAIDFSLRFLVWYFAMFFIFVYKGAKLLAASTSAIQVLCPYLFTFECKSTKLLAASMSAVMVQVPCPYLIPVSSIMCQINVNKYILCTTPDKPWSGIYK